MPELTLITIKNQKQNSPCRFLSISRMAPFSEALIIFFDCSFVRLYESWVLLHYYIRIQIYIWPLISDLDLEIWVKFSRSSQSGHILLNCDTNECFKFSGQSDFRTSFCIVYAFFQERIKTKLSKCMHPYSDDGEPRLGIEPSSPAWQAGILTDILTWL